MPRENNFIVRILLHSILKLPRQHIRNRLPCLPEPAVRPAAVADVGDALLDEVQVCDPGVDGAGAAEGEDEEFVGCVCGEKAGDVAVFVFA